GFSNINLPNIWINFSRNQRPFKHHNLIQVLTNSNHIIQVLLIRLSKFPCFGIYKLNGFSKIDKTSSVAVTDPVILRIPAAGPESLRVRNYSFLNYMRRNLNNL